MRTRIREGDAKEIWRRFWRYFCYFWPLWVLMAVAPVLLVVLAATRCGMALDGAGEASLAYLQALGHPWGLMEDGGACRGSQIVARVFGLIVFVGKAVLVGVVVVVSEDFMNYRRSG